MAPLSRYRGEGRAAEVVQEVAEGRRSSVLDRVLYEESSPPVTSRT